VLYEFTKCRPDQITEALAEFPCAYVPLGSLEWHGPHLPLGFDGLKAERLLYNSAKVLEKGVLFPTWYYGAYNTLNFPFTFHFSRRSLQTQLKNFFEDLIQMGFRLIILLTGHYPPQLVAFLQKYAKKYMQKYPGVYILACPDFHLIESQDTLGDHAGSTETALSAFYYPDQTDLSRFPRNLSFTERSQRFGVFDASFDTTKSLEYGKQLAAEIEHNIVKRINRVWVEKDAAAFNEVYARANSVLKKTKSLQNWRTSLQKIGITTNSELKSYLKWILFHRGQHNSDF
jgi:creatinine amidohydrolase